MSNSSVARYTLKFIITLLIIGGLYLVYQLKTILLVFFIALILAATLKPGVVFLKNKLGIPKPVGIVGIYLILLTLIGTFAAVAIPPLIAETDQIVKVFSKDFTLPDLKVLWSVESDLEVLSSQLQNLESIISTYGETISGIMIFFKELFTSLVLLFTVLVVSFYFILSFEQLSSVLELIIPGNRKSKQEEAQKISLMIQQQLGSWVRGRALVMFLIGVITYIGLSLMGVPFALALSIMAALLEIIPNIGPVLSAIPAVIVAFTVNPILGLAVIAFYTTLQQVESSVITPQVMKHAIEVNPITSIFLVLSGAQVMGISGSILALPLYICVRLLVKELAGHYKHLFD